MVIGLLAITAIPTVTGISLASSEQRKANQRKEDNRRMMKFNIQAECDGDTDDDRELNGMSVVVRNGKVYLADPNPSNRSPPAFTALAFYIEYPELDETKHLDRGLGLPTYVQEDPPLLNWIYADNETYELRYGNRSQSVEHVVGPWDWCKDERIISLEKKKKAFYAVEEKEGEWALYFDRDGDELERVLEKQGLLDCAFVPVTLVRRIVEEKPPAQSQSQPQGQEQGQGQGQNGKAGQK
ncbi:hypothetical protein N7499_005537 [Penicillium canescens]|uniref:Uncharacterized protein n=1 Tax=Penicillium canescens TaxID=5083 RepID=A0AAD6N8Q4_PENCN|nr:uncharacterized protein N7446_001303 [Penicillium canescens]KAJ5998083.1 hypothetical protein N7522_009743 [Penicillium canescens]KAJ6043107.1 hypothetical protein N7460_004462 [Penicillium canescens]KAJ6054583.1 hypothetical protein N7444_003681 [Penicillium canescens]KAJ6073526.1 hypothetical protein N7446_001303 [Penicillium canescens]KAJ6080663.1 hypothetical protein N7499_005537 [Penicillium canescens]